MSEIKKFKIKKGKKLREVFEVDGERYTKTGVELTRASKTMTEAEFFAWILSHCRKLTQRWKPAQDKLNEGRISYNEYYTLLSNEYGLALLDRRTKWYYHCEGCNKYFKRKEIDLDHIIPCGGINSFDKIEGWFRRAFVEKDGFQRLCHNCHTKKSREERK